MLKKINYGKIIVVVLITVLIWVWADLALDEKLPVSGATISVAKSANLRLLADFNDEPSVDIEKMVLKGSASRIADVKRRLRDGDLSFEFFFDPEQEAMTNPGEYSLDVLNFLKQSSQIRQLGLTVESCKPETLSVNVIRLVKKSLTVTCVDKDQNPIKGATIDPPQVNMFVPEDWDGEKLTATVLLTGSERDQARITPVPKTPYIELAGRKTEAQTSVKITTPQQEDRLTDYTITAVTLGFTSSANLQGKYKVELINRDAVMSPIAIRSTPVAKRTYENMTYQVILEIHDSDKDAKSAEPLKRQLVYNFPEEYVRKDEIVLKQQPVDARFRLIPLPDIQAQPSAEP
jgi:hypothetical protein